MQRAGASGPRDPCLWAVPLPEKLGHRLACLTSIPHLSAAAPPECSPQVNHHKEYADEQAQLCAVLVEHFHGSQWIQVLK